MFLSCGLDDRREMNELMTLLVVHKVCQTLSPCVLKFNEDFYKLQIVLELGIDDFDVLFILLKKIPEV